MATFAYRAATPDGKIVDGTLTASSRETAVERLQSEGQIPIRIDEARQQTPKKNLARFRLRRRIREEQIADATRELGILLRAGLPLERALQILVSLHAEEPLGAVLENIRFRVKEGAALAEAVSAQGNTFPGLYTSLLQAGESGGALEVTLERLADHLDRTKELRDAIVSATIYPAILVVVAVVSIVVLLGYVVPQFREMFDGVDQVLPLSTRITLAVGDFVSSYGLALFAILGACAWFLMRWLQRPVNRLPLHARMLRLPMAGALLLKIEVARFARTLSILMRNGVPLLKALDIVRDTVMNLSIGRGLGIVLDGLKQGATLADLLGEHAHFPILAVQMIRVGEESGNLPDILEQVAESYDRDCQVTIRRALAVLEPVLILLLGAIIGAVIISILGAILSVNEIVM